MCVFSNDQTRAHPTLPSPDRVGLPGPSGSSPTGAVPPLPLGGRGTHLGYTHPYECWVPARVCCPGPDSRRAGASSSGRCPPHLTCSSCLGVFLSWCLHSRLPEHRWCPLLRWWALSFVSKKCTLIFFCWGMILGPETNFLFAKELRWAFLKAVFSRLSRFQLPLVLISEVLSCNLVYASSFSERDKVERRDGTSTESAPGISSLGKNNEEWKGICKSGSH